MVRIRTRQVEKWEVLLVHDEGIWNGVERTAFISRETLAMQCPTLERESSLYLNEHSALCARLSAGSLIEMCDAVAERRIRNGFAVIRPPGHHAEPKQSMGFCLYNNVAVASRWLQNKYKDGPNKVQKILILDWDVHHGNGTQLAFDEDPSVLYMSLHRHDGGDFYPGGPFGSMHSVGRGAGAGYSVNVPWPSKGMGDGDYLHAFQRIIMPIAYEYAPDMVIISAGFDAAAGDPLGECFVSPAGYAHMTQMLNALADGRLIVALEGGYEVNAIAHSAVAVAKVLLGGVPSELPAGTACGPIAANTCRQVAQVQSKYWRSIPREHEAADASMDEDLPKVELRELVRHWRTHHLWNSYGYSDVPLPEVGIPRPSLVRLPASQTQVMCNKDLFEKSWEAVILFAHDMGNLRVGQQDIQTEKTVGATSYLIDSTFALYDRAREKNYAVVDVNFFGSFPIGLTEQKGLQPQATANAATTLSALATQTNEELLYTWDNLIDVCDTENIILVGYGQACHAITNLVEHRSVRGRTKAVVQIMGMSTLPLAPRDDVDTKRWYYRNSKVICPQHHPFFAWGGQKRACKRLGRVERSSELALMASFS
ncbi:Arginase/deacetylase [Tilletiaria anomala UBC 951]|uniref:histone deacetylase n=1 Tax=Tilletiaria anomala (strain ATCC 24038 / CBS 436.72 / UBC 951) TaxID=1037660 RepID=A0A066VX10_TILAU|nr:Arginase/deacetylase [Tilletiaria anomala UBC 951]KDN43090.1 Arginase/deacetylase [Tilletiaria anomala UBC 951]